MRDVYLWQGSKGGDVNQWAKLVAGDGLFLEKDGIRNLVISSSGVAASLSESTTSGSGLTLDLAESDRYKIILEDNITVALDNPSSGGKYTFIFKQTLGGNTVAWPANVQWAGGSAPVITAASGAVDIVTMIYDNFDDVYWASAAQDFS